jgi:NAD kinase
MKIEKIIIVTKKTRLEELVERFNSRAQAKFWIEHNGSDFSDVEREDATYRRALDRLRGDLAKLAKLQVVERAFLPTMVFAATDLVVTLGGNGLVVNAAKYVEAQPIIAVNPDPERFDGILLMFKVEQAAAAAKRVIDGKAAIRKVTLAEAQLNDGQGLLAFNDFYIGTRTHVAARYRIAHGKAGEKQISSGILVSTGAGSTGWINSCLVMAAGVSAFMGQKVEARPLALKWEDERLAFVVREPAENRRQRVTMVAGMIEKDGELVIESLMPSGGCIFSDGIESDFVAFNTGAVAKIRVAKRKAHLVAA